MLFFLTFYSSKDPEKIQTHTDITVYMRFLLHTYILTCYFSDRSSAAVLMSWREKKRLYNSSLLLIYHAAQSIMGRISRQSVLIHQRSFTDDPEPMKNPG